MKTKPSPPFRANAARKAAKPGKARLDVLLVDSGLALSRERAQALLLAGQVRVNGQMVNKAGIQVAKDAKIEIAGEAQRYASRGGRKLEGALEDFGVSPRDKVCADIGSSTGGFTDCLLQKGARKVHAVDVTIGQLDWKLRQDPRVVTRECNARYLKPEDFGEAVDMICMDASFISAAKILPALPALANPGADFLILIKPQFELERNAVGKGGIVRDAALHERAIARVTESAKAAGLEIVGVRASRLAGTQGNQEFFLHARNRR